MMYSKAKIAIRPGISFGNITGFRLCGFFVDRLKKT